MIPLSMTQDQLTALMTLKDRDVARKADLGVQLRKLYVDHQAQECVEVGVEGRTMGHFIVQDAFLAFEPSELIETTQHQVADFLVNVARHLVGEVEAVARPTAAVQEHEQRGKVRSQELMDLLMKD